MVESIDLFVEVSAASTLTFWKEKKSPMGDHLIPNVLICEDEAASKGKGNPNSFSATGISFNSVSLFDIHFRRLKPADASKCLVSSRIICTSSKDGKSMFLVDCSSADSAISQTRRASITKSYCLQAISPYGLSRVVTPKDQLIIRVLLPHSYLPEHFFDVCVKGPISKCSFKDVPSRVFAAASKTTRSLVVVLDSLRTAWCGTK